MQNELPKIASKNKYGKIYCYPKPKLYRFMGKMEKLFWNNFIVFFSSIISSFFISLFLQSNYLVPAAVLQGKCVKTITNKSYKNVNDLLNECTAYYGMHLKTTLTLHSSLVFMSLPAITLELFCIMLVRGEAAFSKCSDESDSFEFAGPWAPILP